MGTGASVLGDFRLGGARALVTLQSVAFSSYTSNKHFMKPGRGLPRSWAPVAPAGS